MREAEIEVRLRRGEAVIERSLSLSLKKSGRGDDRPWWVKTRDFIFRRPPLPDLGILGRERPMVGRVMANSPAAEAGVEIGDVVLSVNGSPVRNRLQSKRSANPSGQ